MFFKKRFNDGSHFNKGFLSITLTREDILNKGDYLPLKQYELQIFSLNLVMPKFISI